MRTADPSAHRPGDLPGAVLGVWAHPDDEAYLSAALMARSTDAGHRVVVATATRGEHGTSDPEQWPPHRLGPQRERELAASLAVLGVREHHWFGHRDGTLAELPLEPEVARVGRLLDAVAPDTVVTFGPDGMTGHRDHRAVSTWVTAAWERRGRPCRLWYATVTPEFHRDWAATNATIGMWEDQPIPPVTPEEDLAHVVRCDEELLDRKHAALRAHSSQTAGLEELLGTHRYRAWWATEWFVSAARVGAAVEERTG